jgi:hypothetical protein
MQTYNFKCSFIKFLATIWFDIQLKHSLEENFKYMIDLWLEFQS